MEYQSGIKHSRGTPPELETEKGFSSQNISWHGTLRFRLTFILFFLALAIALSSLSVLWFQARPLLVKENYEINRQVGENIVSSLGQQIRQIEAITSQIALVGAQIGNKPDLVVQLIPELLNYHDLKHVIAGGGVWPEPYEFDPNLERNSYFWGRNADGSLSFYDDYNDPKSAGYHHEEWYTPSKITESRKPYWSRSYIDPYSLQPMVTCTVPMFRDGRFIGVATIDLMLEGVADLVKEKTQPHGGYAFLVDRNNRFISFPHPDSVRTTRSDDKENITEALQARDLAKIWHSFKPISEMLYSINASLIEDNASKHEVISNTATAIAEDSYQIELDEAHRIAHNYFTSSGSQQSLEINRITIPTDILLNEPATVSFFKVPGTSWTLVTLFPLDNTLESAQRITYQLSLFMIVFIFCCIGAAYIFLKASLFKRLNIMQNRLQQISDHESEAIKLPEDSQDELGQIAHWFNKRTEALFDALQREKLNSDELEKEYQAQKRTSRLLRISNATNQAILDNAHLAILTTDIRGYIASSSLGTEKLIGYKKEHVIGKRFDQGITIKHYHSPNALKVDSFLDLINHEKKHQHQKLYGLCQHKDGRWLDASIDVSTIRESQELNGYLIVINDISQQKLIEKELINAKELAEKHSQAKSNFLANMSHELRTPLNAIIGFAKRLEKTLKPTIEPKHGDALLTIHRSATHLLSLINDLLDISKIEAGKLEVTPAKFDFNQLIEEVYQQTGELIDNPSLVEYKINLPEEKLFVHADRKQLTQVLFNLTSNAIKATESGSVEISLEKADDEHIKFMVSDTGKGMSAVQLKHLFKKFTQFETYHLNRKSTGLGLYITYQFITMHRGNIDVQSTVDEGTRFTITLPTFYDPSQSRY